MERIHVGRERSCGCGISLDTVQQTHLDRFGEDAMRSVISKSGNTWLIPDSSKKLDAYKLPGSKPSSMLHWAAGKYTPLVLASHWVRIVLFWQDLLFLHGIKKNSRPPSGKSPRLEVCSRDMSMRMICLKIYLSSTITLKRQYRIAFRAVPYIRHQAGLRAPKSHVQQLISIARQVNQLMIFHV